MGNIDSTLGDCFMLPKFAKIGYPLGKFRLVASIATALAVGSLLVLVSTNLNWLTFTRLLYVIFGIAAGLLLEYLKLNRNTKTTRKQ